MTRKRVIYMIFKDESVFNKLNKSKHKKVGLLKSYKECNLEEYENKTKKLWS